MEKPGANSKHKDAKRLMRATHVKPPNTNTLTATKLKRGYGALLSPQVPKKGGQWHSSLEKVLRVWSGGEVSTESRVLLTMALRSMLLEYLSRTLNQDTDILGTRDAKPSNLPLKESAMTSETHWSKPALPPHPSPLNLSYLSTSLPPPAMQH